MAPGGTLQQLQVTASGVALQPQFIKTIQPIQQQQQQTQPPQQQQQQQIVPGQQQKQISKVKAMKVGGSSSCLPPAPVHIFSLSPP